MDKIFEIRSCIEILANDIKVDNYWPDSFKFTTRYGVNCYRSYDAINNINN